MQIRWMWMVLVLGVCLSAQAAMLPDAPAGGAGDIVATVKWETPDADIDLAIEGPNGQAFAAEQDFTNGPATERVVIRNPVPGQYKVGVLWFNDKAGVTVPVAVEVKQGDKVLASFQANLTKVPDDRKVVEFAVGQGAQGEGAKDPLGFVGRWVEYWPGVNAHDVTDITFNDGQYQVKVTNPDPQIGAYKVDNIRLDGAVLKFTEYPGNSKIDYEVRIQDPNTCSVMVQGGPPVDGQISWRREGGAGGAGGAGDLVTVAKWETQGADVDLRVIGPDGQTFQHAQDIMSGPAAEVCTVQNARPGEYKAEVVLCNGKEGVQVPVTVEAKLGDKVIGTFQVTLDADNNRRVFSGIKVGP